MNEGQHKRLLRTTITTLAVLLVVTACSASATTTNTINDSPASASGSQTADVAEPPADEQESEPPADEQESEPSPLADFPDNLAALSQTQMNDILDIDYAGLTGSDRQLWIDVYASEYEEGFYKSLPPGSTNRIAASGDATIDVVDVEISLGPIDPATESLVVANLCSSEATIWLFDQGITLDVTLRGSNDASIQVTVNDDVCGDRAVQG